MLVYSESWIRNSSVCLLHITDSLSVAVCRCPRARSFHCLLSVSGSLLLSVENVVDAYVYLQTNSRLQAPSAYHQVSFLTPFESVSAQMWHCFGVITSFLENARSPSDLSHTHTLHRGGGGGISKQTINWAIHNSSGRPHSVDSTCVCSNGFSQQLRRLREMPEAQDKRWALKGYGTAKFQWASFLILSLSFFACFGSFLRCSVQGALGIK